MPLEPDTSLEPSTEPDETAGSGPATLPETPAVAAAPTPPEPPAPPRADEPKRPTQTLPSTRKSAGPLAVIALERILDDTTLALRPVQDVEALARSVAQLGQLFPVELRLQRPNKYQVVAGFRRVAACRMLNRPRVLARVHPDLSDEDALLIALAELCESRPRDEAAIAAVRDRLATEGRLFALASEMIDRALAPPEEGTAPQAADEEAGEEEVELETLVDDVLGRLASVNEDLAAIVELWADVDGERRAALVEQLGYPRSLAEYLEGQR